MNLNDRLREFFDNTISPTSVNTLAVTMNVSADQLRRAMNRLVMEGYLTRRKTHLQRRFAAHRTTKEYVYQRKVTE